MSRNNYIYTSLLQDETFSHLNMNKVRRLIAWAIGETFGTGFFVALGCAAVAMLDSHLEVVLSFAFGIGLSICIFFHVSGSVMNPSLAISLVVMGHMSIYKFVYYVIFECIGATLGVLFIKNVTPKSLPDSFCCTLPAVDVGIWQAFAIEFFISTALCLLVLSLVEKSKESIRESTIWSKFAFGVTALALPSAKYTGCSMNPARSFGAALANNYWDHHWIYWTSPLLAGIFAGLIYRFFMSMDILRNPGNKREDTNNGA